MDVLERIVFEDSDILIINKPAGILTVPGDRRQRQTLLQRVNHFLETRDTGEHVYACHRLDRDTSGLVVFAKNKNVRDMLMQQFKEESVHKRYLAFIAGTIRPPRGTITFRIEQKKAVTHYNLLEKRRGFSVIDVQPETGRTNQIRIHCKLVGHPLLGERKFAFGKDFTVKFRRTALHAYSLTFNHPCSKRLMRFHCELPDDMSRLIGGSIKVTKLTT